MQKYDRETYLLLLKEIKEIRERVDKIEAILSAEIEQETGKEGIAMAELLDLRVPLRKIMLELTKVGRATSAELSEKLDMSEETVNGMIEALIERGYIKEKIEQGERKYEVSLARKKLKKLPLDIWVALENKLK